MLSAAYKRGMKNDKVTENPVHENSLLVPWKLVFRVDEGDQFGKAGVLTHVVQPGIHENLT